MGAGPVEAEPGPAVVGSGLEDRANGPDEVLRAVGDVEQVVVELALGDGGRDDRPAGPHVVHDLGGAAGAVEGVVGAVGNEADVEAAVILVDLVLRPPADDVDVGPRHAPAIVVVPGGSSCQLSVVSCR